MLRNSIIKFLSYDKNLIFYRKFSQKLDNNQIFYDHNSFNYDDFFDSKIKTKINDGSYRSFKQIERHASRFPLVKHQNYNNKEVTIWCSNDYLGLGIHPYVQSKVIEAVNKYGVGSGGTRNISGNTPLHLKLEKELANLHEKQSALLFTSCYVANETTLYTLGQILPNCHIISDSGNHASMIQGIRNSGRPKHIFKHNDCEHLESILKEIPIETPKIVAFESVHSMDGSICDLARMCDVTHKYGGITYIDEVHAVGLYGQNGAGIGERDQVLNKMDIITGTLGKAFGNIGGYIAGSSQLIDMIRSYGSGFIFTTSLPPSVCAGSLAALEISKSDEGRELRKTHQLNASIVKNELNNANLPVMNGPSHIVPVLIGDNKQANEICNKLMNDYNIYIQSINYPTVARGAERLRIVPNPFHTLDMIKQLVHALIDSFHKVGLDFKMNS
jgi:5-aminolevulinate synthase